MGGAPGDHEGFLHDRFAGGAVTKHAMGQRECRHMVGIVEGLDFRNARGGYGMLHDTSNALPCQPQFFTAAQAAEFRIAPFQSRPLYAR